jgi:RHS repeat-associated protein
VNTNFTHQDQKGKSTSEEQKSFSVPSISLPKGGGAIRGMGDEFSANRITGTASMSVPIAASPGRSGFGPQLNLTYDSGSGNGPFGFGWSFSLPAITRKTDEGLPRYEDARQSDVFILSGAEDLVPVPGSVGSQRTVNNIDFRIERYRPRIEGLFARIERWTNLGTGESHWRSISRDNVTTLYGTSNNSRIFDPGDPDPQHPNRIFSWLICARCDNKGNLILYSYKAEDSTGVDPSQVNEKNRTDQSRSPNRYIKHIFYGNHQPYFPNYASNQPPTPLPQEWLFELVFDYGEHHPDAPTPNDSGNWLFRSDPFSSYRSCFEVRTSRLCQRALMFHHFPAEPGVGKDCLVHSTDFLYSYEQDPSNARNPVYTFLQSVTQTGYKRHNSGYLKRSLPPLEFEYSQPVVNEIVQELDASSLENLPAGVDGTTYQWADLHGEGIPGILSEQAGSWFYNRNLSPINVQLGNGLAQRKAQFAPAELVHLKPNLSLGDGRAQLMDLAGDGQPDLVTLDGPTPGLYEHDSAEGWHSFRPFSSLLNRDMQDPNLRFVDLDGDGHIDILISDEDAFIWYGSLAEQGFGPARRVKYELDQEKGPRLVFADGTQAIYLADMSGDGLSDIVRIWNSEICYWPNLGYGRFGARVMMDHAPHLDSMDDFDHRRLVLADIDGTGTTDIIYLHRDGVRLYFNQSGNGWSAPQSLNVFPPVDNTSTITMTDLLGNGTLCMVWSSPLPGDTGRQMRYVDLMGGQKPYLLIKSINNLGAETHVHYAPSTKFYLQDKRDGKPWITRLPFPVQVVERVETYDHISHNRFVTRYAYHHGCFDGEEREFRGFGMVEQWDTEEYGNLVQGQDFPTGDNIAEYSHLPPVLTKTWFHTGIYFGHDHVSNYFSGLVDENDTGEYYREPGLSDLQARELLLEDTPLPDGLTAQEAQEACRALKGAMLRQEVYALDGTDKAQHPYLVTEQNFTVRLLQPRADQRHAVFFTHAREALNYEYERNPSDPRISHALTLEVDDFGNILREIAIGYGRRHPDMSLSVQDQAKQMQTLITCTQNKVTNAIDLPILPDDYRAPLPCETRIYELTGIHPQAARFSFKEWTDNNFSLSASPSEIPYEQDADPLSQQKRLIEHARFLFRKDDMSDLSPLGEVELLALPGENYKLAFTSGLLSQVFQRDGLPLLPNPAIILGSTGADGGGYVISQDLKSAGSFPPGDPDDQWWIPSGRVFFSPDDSHIPSQERAYAQNHFFLPHRYRGPFLDESLIAFDGYDLLMLDTRDALGNRVSVGERLPSGDLDPTKPGNDYRVLQPWRMMDPNRNRTQVVFDSLGMVVGTALMGKPPPDPVQGDLLDGFETDLTQAQVDGFYEADDPHIPAFNLLLGATTRIIYDLDRFRRTRQAHPTDASKWLPVFASTLAREAHVSGPPPPSGLKIQITFSYSDGFGREIQKKIQAEPEPANGGGQEPTPRWVGSGWTIFNNKGKPVRQYEPFFSQLPARPHQFEFGVQAGVSATLFYDPVGRPLVTLHPNHTYEKIIFDPWQQVVYDVNDTVAASGTQTGDPRTDPDVAGYVHGYFQAQPAAWETWYAQRQAGTLGLQEQAAAARAADHAGTPTRTCFDTLGRTFLTIAHNKVVCPGHHLDGTQDQLHTRVELDIEGNQRLIRDAMQQGGNSQGRVVMRYRYDMLGNHIHQYNLDSRDRWVLNDVTGKPIRAWDSRGHTFRAAYDVLRRQTHLYVQQPGKSEMLVERTVYGEAHPDALARNLMDRTLQQYDGAGVTTNGQFDFKGNLLSSSRQLAVQYKERQDWSALDGLNSVQALADAAKPLLEPTTFTASSSYDALNRPISLVTPDNSEVLLTYNEASLLEAIGARLRGTTTITPFVTGIDYDAKGQRERIVQGDQFTTQYEYDLETFRLTRITTTRREDNALLQDLRYTYDPAGNLTDLRDDAQQTVFFNNTVLEPHASYIYDAIYRLIKATGREHIGQTANNLPQDRPELKPHYDFNDSTRCRLPHPNDGQAMRKYAQLYDYDQVGNFVTMVHQANGGSWTRHYEYAQGSNQLLSTSLPGDPETGPFSAKYEHDPHGNLTKMPHLSLMRWDFEDQLQAVSKQAVNNGGTPEITYYIYDAAGQRVRKVTERQAAAGQTPTRMKEHLYLGGYEIFRQYGGNGVDLTLERETLQIMDVTRRLALVETLTREEGADVPSPLPATRYQLGNHIGSASLELDQAGGVISYEEYHPFGSTSFQAGRSLTEVSRKRYRYVGKEKDEESGLDYFGARYYACWLGRWTAVDPAGLAGGPSAYVYVRGNPIALVDPSGAAPKPGTVDYKVMTMTDSQLIAHLKSMSPEQRGNFATAASGAFKTRVEAARKVAGLSAVYTIPEVTIVGDPKAGACNRCHETPASARSQFEKNDEKVIPGFGPELVSINDLETAFGPSTPSLSFTEKVTKAWEQGSTADKVEMAATGVGVGSVAIPYAGDYVSFGASVVVFGAKPSWEAAGDVGMDAVGAAMPFLGPLGTARRAEQLMDAADDLHDIDRLEMPDFPPPRTAEERLAQADALRDMGLRAPPSKHQSSEYRKAQAELRARSIDDPDLPAHIRGWLKQERRQRGPNPANWRNPRGYDTGHIDPNDSTRLRWETGSQNRSRGARFKHHPNFR